MRKSIAVVLTIVFVVLAPVVLLLWHMQASLTNPEFYTGELRKYDIYTQAIDLTAKQLTESLDQMEGGQDIWKVVSRQEVTDAVKQLVTADWLQTQTEMVINKTFNWFKTKKDINSLQIIISLADFKKRAVVIINEKIIDKLNSLPVCTAKEAKLLEQNNQGGIPTCLPREMNRQEIIKAINVDELVKNVPDDLDVIAAAQGKVKFTEEKTNNQPVKPNTDNAQKAFAQITLIRSYYQQAVLAIKLALIVLATIFAYIIILAATSWRSASRWLGFTLFIPGLMVTAGLMAAVSLLSKNISRLNLQGVPEALAVSLKKMIFDFYYAVTSGPKIEAMIGLAAGLVFIVVSFIIKRKVKKQ